MRREWEGGWNEQDVTVGLGRVGRKSEEQAMTPLGLSRGTSDAVRDLLP